MYFRLFMKFIIVFVVTAAADADIDSMFILPDGLPQEVPESDDSPTKQPRKVDILPIHSFVNSDAIFPKVSLQKDISYNPRQQHKKSSMSQSDKTYYPSSNTTSSRSEISKLQSNQPISLLLMLNVNSKSNVPRKPQKLPLYQRNQSHPTSSWKSEAGEITKPGLSKTYLQQLQLPEGNLPGPALRHRIANYCPNLEIARICVRKCMKQGKGAFCCEDDVCYCGYDYGVPTEHIFIDPEKVRLQYKDVYTKNIGPLSSSSLKSILW